MWKAAPSEDSYSWGGGGAFWHRLMPCVLREVAAERQEDTKKNRSSWIIFEEG